MSNPCTYIGNAPVFLAVKALRTVKLGTEYLGDLTPVRKFITIKYANGKYCLPDFQIQKSSISFLKKLIFIV